MLPHIRLVRSKVSLLFIDSRVTFEMDVLLTQFSALDIVTTNQPAKEHAETNVDWYGRSKQATDICSIKRVSGGVDTVELRRVASRRVDKEAL